MAGSNQGIMIGDSVLSLIDTSLSSETSSSISSEFSLQNFFPALGSLTPPVKPSKTSLKTYNEKWERDPLLRTWIARHPTDPGKVVCCFCNSLVRAHKNDLLEHTRTVKHQRNYMPNVSPAEYKQFIFDLNELKKEMKNLTNRKMCSSNSALANSKKSRNSNGDRSQEPVKPSGSPSVPFDWENSLGPDDLESHIRRLEGDQDDVDGIMADSPSDLVSVVLEEPETSREPATIQPVTPKPKRKRPVQQQSSLPKSNGAINTSQSGNKHSGSTSTPQQHSISSAQNFLKLLNAVQSDTLTLNELLLLKKSIDTRITGMTLSPKGSQVKVLPSRNISSSPNLSLSSISKNNGVTITSVGVAGTASNHSASRKRKQEYIEESLPVSPVSASLKTEMIDVTPDVSDYGIVLTNDINNDDYFDEQFTD